nr:NB-ARC domains-containing protein [Tanacetum cinerariifolium]
MLKKLNFTYCNLVQVPESIGGLSCLEELDLEGNNFTSLPESLSQLSHLRTLVLIQNLGQQRLWNLSEVYDLLSGKKVEITAAVEVLVLLLKKSSEKVHIDATGFAHLKKLRILKIYQSHKYLQEFELKNYNVKFSGKNIVAVDLSYSNIKQLWTTPK